MSFSKRCARSSRSPSVSAPRIRRRSSTPFCSRGVGQGRGRDGDLLHPGDAFAEAEGERPHFSQQLVAGGVQAGVQRAAPLQMQAAGEQAALGPGRDGCLQRRADRVVNSCHVVEIGDIGLDVLPADDVVGPRVHRDHVAAVDRHRHRPLRARLADVAALQISRKDDVRAFVQDLALMDMAQRPIVVARIHQIGKGAGRVVRMPALAAEAGVQDPDVEIAGERRRVGLGEVLIDVAPGKALAMQRDRKVGMVESLGRFGAKGLHVAGQREVAGDLALGVVVAVQQIDRDPGGIEPAHLRREIEAGRIVAPLPVIEIAGDDHEVDPLGNGLVDQPLEGLACRAANTLRRRVLLSRQAAQRAVQVDIGGVQETKFGQDAGTPPPGGRESIP